MSSFAGGPLPKRRRPTRIGRVRRRRLPLRAAGRRRSALRRSAAPPAAPVTPSPKVGNDQWSRQGPERPVAGPNGAYVPGPIFSENSLFRDNPPDAGPPPRPLTINISTEETMTGRLMFGVGINSDAGLVGQVVLDEQNFNWARLPTSWEDIADATAWRGAGQRLRIQAMPGTQVQNYSVNFTEPYMFGTQVSLQLGGYYYNRIYNEYTDQRLGGSIGFGYAIHSRPLRRHHLQRGQGQHHQSDRPAVARPGRGRRPRSGDAQLPLIAQPGQTRQRLPRHRRVLDGSIDRRDVGLVPVSAGAGRPAKVLHPLRAARRLGAARVDASRPAPVGRGTTRRFTTASMPAVSRRSAASSSAGRRRRRSAR